jgi:hypothetical protein
MIKALKASFVVLAIVMTALPASARTSTQEYVGSFDPLTFGRCADATVPVNVGKVCFKVAAGETRVKFTSVDTALGEAGMFYIMRDAAGGCVGDTGDPTTSCPNDGFICGHSGTLAIPATTVSIEVYLDSILGVVSCQVLSETSAIGAATTGTVSAIFS